MSTLYLDCSSGISGDMTVSALLDLGADQSRLLAAIDSLHIEGFRIRIGRRTKCGIDAASFDVELEEDAEHANEPTHAKAQEAEEAHEAACEHRHEHAHEHAHTHTHRNLSDVYAIIDRASALSDTAKKNAKRMFFIVAEAEAAAHGLPIEQVHFHEVGAIDSIIDIVSVAFLMEELGITKVLCSPLSEGRGSVRCQHGILPVPVPAVANIAAAHHLPMKTTEVTGEMVTPTGAAIVAAYASSFLLPDCYTIQRIGIGSGKKEFPHANILRAMILEKNVNLARDPRLFVLETNVDDCSGELLGHAMDALFFAGARDVFYSPIFMKKNRPAYLLRCICTEDNIPKLEAVLFRETTTIGIRRYPVERTALARELRTVSTPYGDVEVKVCTAENGETYYYPEYESLRRVCDASGQRLGELYSLAAVLAKQADTKTEEHHGI